MQILLCDGHWPAPRYQIKSVAHTRFALRMRHIVVSSSSVTIMRIKSSFTFAQRQQQHKLFTNCRPFSLFGIASEGDALTLSSATCVHFLCWRPKMQTAHTCHTSLHTNCRTTTKLSYVTKVEIFQKECFISVKMCLFSTLVHCPRILSPFGFHRSSDRTREKRIPCWIGSTFLPHIQAQAALSSESPAAANESTYVIRPFITIKRPALIKDRQKSRLINELGINHTWSDEVYAFVVVSFASGFLCTLIKLASLCIVTIMFLVEQRQVTAGGLIRLSHTKNLFFPCACAETWVTYGKFNTV